MPYLGNSPGVSSQRVVSTFTATSGQTTFTPISGYTLGYIDVYLNGIRLVDGDDYTAANGMTVVLTSGAAVGDAVQCVAFFPRGLSDGYLKSEADARYVGLTGDQTIVGSKQFNNNLAIGYTSNAWGSAYKILQIGSAAILANNAGASDLYSNVYYDGTNFRYMANGYGSIYSFSGGQHRWYAMGNNTSGAGAIGTYVQNMALSASGDLALGNDVPRTGGGAGKWLTFYGAGTGYSGGPIYVDGTTTKAYHYYQNNYLVSQGESGVGMKFLINGGAAAVLIDTSGNLVLPNGSGISFTNTGNGSGSMSSEILSDYEEGTWTPVWNGGGTLGASRCRYTKIGRMVTLHATLDMGNNVNGGVFQLSGLPYSSSSSVEATCAIMTNNIDYPSGYTMLTNYFYGGVSYMQPYWSGNNVSWTPLTNAQAANASMIFTMTYEAS